MFTLPETRFEFGGDEYIYAEISRDMSEESNFKALAVTSELRSREIPGILDICPSNASYLIRFDPEIISAYDLLEYLREIDMTKFNFNDGLYPRNRLGIPIRVNESRSDSNSQIC